MIAPSRVGQTRDELQALQQRGTHLVEFDFGRFPERRETEIARLKAWVGKLFKSGQLDDDRLRREPVLQQVGDERGDPDVCRAKLILGVRPGLVRRFRDSGDLHPEVSDESVDASVDGGGGAFLDDEGLAALDDAMRHLQRQQRVRVRVRQLLLEDLQRELQRSTTARRLHSRSTSLGNTWVRIPKTPTNFHLLFNLKNYVFPISFLSF